MKSKIIISMAVSAILLSSGCQHRMEDSYQPSGKSMTVAQVQTEGKIIGSIMVLNKNEIAAASLAERKSSNVDVKNYARMMSREHSKNLQELEKLSDAMHIMPIEGSTAMMLHKKGKHEMAALNRMNGKAFDKAYIGAMVKGHGEALQMLDHKLIPEATDPHVRKFLEMTRSHVMAHLQLAKKIQQELMH